MSLEKKILDQVAKDKKKMGGGLAYWMDSRKFLKELGVVAKDIAGIFDEEIEEQRIQGVDEDVLFAWNTIKKRVLKRLVEKEKKP